MLSTAAAAASAAPPPLASAAAGAQQSLLSVLATTWLSTERAAQDAHATNAAPAPAAGETTTERPICAHKRDRGATGEPAA
jgi:hypothetical protein